MPRCIGGSLWLLMFFLPQFGFGWPRGHVPVEWVAECVCCAVRPFDSLLGQDQVSIA